MEQEIKKHTSKIVSEFRNTKKPFWKKVGGIAIEMLVIVFAVTFAAFIERNREHSHEQKEVKEFLLGLKTDLENDINEMGDDKKGYVTMGFAFRYYLGADKLHEDSIKKYDGLFGNTINLLVNDGRFEGFKSSGKINTIENINLRNEILDLYQERMISLLGSTQAYSETKRELRKILYKHAVIDSGRIKNLDDIIRIPEIRNYFNSLCFVGEPLRRYDTTIEQSRRIIKMINKEYELESFR